MFKKIAAFFKGATSLVDVVDKLKTASQQEIDDLVINKLPPAVYALVYNACQKREAMGK